MWQGGEVDTGLTGTGCFLVTRGKGGLFHSKCSEKFQVRV